MSLGAALKKHVLVTTAALIVGLLAVWWIRPLTSAGTTLILVVATAIFNAIAVMMPEQRERAGADIEPATDDES
jgi:hypothetical protein